MRKPVLKRFRTYKSLSGLHLLKMKASENQLIENDLGRQNIFGQNKGWQR
jgi:hypothetical protein